jgi:hypothetical protein
MAKSKKSTKPEPKPAVDKPAIEKPVAETPAAPTPVAVPAKPAKPKKLSALDAAAKVLADAGQPMNCTELIDAMTKAKLWTSANGLTPHATLYSAILREQKVKGDAARFVKVERGKFAAKK